MGDMKVNGPTQLHPDVLNREARENERWDGQEKVEEFLVRQAGVHADAVRYDLANAALSFANIGVGAAQPSGARWPRSRTSATRAGRS